MFSSGRRFHSFGIGLVVVDVEELKLVVVLACGDDSQVLAKVLLLEVLLGQVLEITLRHWDVGVNDDSRLLLGDLNGLAEVSSLVINLDSITEVLFLRIEE